jgi:hypothetical protein
VLQPQAASAWTPAAPAVLSAGRCGVPIISFQHKVAPCCAATRAQMIGGALKMSSREEEGGVIRGLLFDCDGTLVNSISHKSSI